ncbi:MAG TPA: TauD/TfdA family dioxygenase [Candidatus Dormibacteraeota bacterium]|nr:TauD/TfdA family dioxygenase [Candidatus Dormibacteraeota bacterium]
MRVDQLAVQVAPEDVELKKSWTRESISPEGWLIPLPADCVAELDEVAAAVRATPRPVDTLDPADFSLRACTAVMASVRAKLETDTGLAVVDRFPVERYGQAENLAIGWLLAAMLGQVVAQKANGTRLYDVKDSGQALGYGVRRSVTNLGQPFHTDGGWLWKAPAFVGLFCLESAMEGGLSRFVSLVTAHHELRRRRPDLLARLYQPFHWDRQGEHAPDAPRVSRQPVFEFEGGTLASRYYEDYVRNGSKMAGEELDDEGTQALVALREIVDDPANWVEFRIEKGQLQYLNNRQFAHSRTAFTDPGPGQGRHMLRLWNRDEGTWHLEGSPAA